MLKIINKHRRKSMCRLQSNEKLCKYGVLIRQKIIILQRINIKWGGFCHYCRKKLVGLRGSALPESINRNTNKRQ